MKDDTHPKIKELLQKRYRSLSGEERVEMATSMFDCARDIVIQSLRNTCPLMTEEELRKALFLRFYKLSLP